MKEEFEYLDDDQSTWKVWEAPPKPDWVDSTLVEIAGLNYRGLPRLRCEWGGTLVSDTSEQKVLKYSCGYSPVEVSGYSYVKDGVTHFTKTIEGVDALIIVPAMYEEELGLLRWVIERWVSPEELRCAHRFEHRTLPGDAAPTLRSFPNEGIYEAFLIVQTPNKKYRALTQDVCRVVKEMWEFSRLPLEQQERLIEKAKRAEVDSRTQAKKDMWAGLGDIRLPDEEIDRRQLIAEVLARNAEKNAILDQRLTFYNPI